MRYRLEFILNNVAISTEWSRYKHHCEDDGVDRNLKILLDGRLPYSLFLAVQLLDVGYIGNTFSCLISCLVFVCRYDPCRTLLLLFGGLLILNITGDIGMFK